MKKINCIVIDDEPLARKGLKEYISEVDFLHLLADFDNPLRAADMIREEGEVLLFLDIQMPKITGIDFFKSLQPAPPVIFTTAYPQYALEGFEVNALDYLVKPFSFDRFLKSAMRARDYFEIRESNSGAGASKDYFFIKADNKLVKLFFDEILYVEALQNYVAIHTSSKKILTYLTIKSVEEFLSQDRFIKIHKSYIISASKIDSIEGNDVRIGTHHLPISRNLKEEVLDRLLKGKFLKR